MTTRRDFLALGLTSLGMTPLIGTFPTLSSKSGKVPLFRFIQINDIHIQTPGDQLYPTYEKANLRFEWLMENLTNERYFPKPDFIIGLGDLIHQHGIDNIPDNLAKFKRVIDRIPIPFFPVMGNHETKQGEGIPEREKPFLDLFGSDKNNYIFEHQGISFIVVHNSGTGQCTDETIRFRESEFRKHLELTKGKRKIILVHIPLVPVRDEEVLASSFGFISYKCIEPGVLELVREHSSEIAAVLSGHLHITGSVLDHGVQHIVVSGTAGIPHDIGYYTVYDDHIHFKAISLPSDKVVPSTNIHGIQRHGQDYTDSKHPDWWSYIAGREDEREIIIPLK
jgi:3',5'-cyclic AMP phosphodiesterase CpdA